MNATVNELLNNATLDDVESDFNKLASRWRTISTHSCVGNLCVDYFTLDERLHTRLKGNVSFYEFLENFEKWYTKRRVARFYDESTYSTHIRRVRNSYKMSIGTCTIFKPLQTLRYLETLPCSVALLDPCAGWGGRLVGACIKNVPAYIGIDSNQNLREPYSQLIEFLSDKTHTKIQMCFMDARVFDYTSVKYDLVMTSPPYYKLEKYRGMQLYDTKREWVDQFYRPVFTSIFESLQLGGAMALNVNEELYRVFAGIFGRESFRIPMDSRGRDQKYKEYLYVWIKK
jgi:hypothetical protein